MPKAQSWSKTFNSLNDQNWCFSWYFHTILKFGLTTPHHPSLPEWGTVGRRWSPFPKCTGKVKKCTVGPHPALGLVQRWDKVFFHKTRLGRGKHVLYPPVAIPDQKVWLRDMLLKPAYRRYRVMFILGVHWITWEIFCIKLERCFTSNQILGFRTKNKIAVFKG